jgi:hypothetical protein
MRHGEPGVVAVEAARKLLLARRFGEWLDSGEVVSQPLLIPATVSLATKQIESLAQLSTILIRLGIVVERLGEDSVVLRQLPPLLRGVEAEALITTLCKLPPSADATAIAAQLAPLLPPPDMAMGERLLCELEQLEGDGVQLPWLALSEERLAALFRG